MILFLIACQAAPVAPESHEIADTVDECPAGRVHNAAALGAPDDVVVELPSGALVAPWVQFQSDRLVVRCPDEGGTLVVGWH